VTKEELFKKLLCFGVDEVMYFKRKNRNHNATQGFIGVIFMGVHCVVHKENLAIKSLGDIEAFMMNMYTYFSHSLKNTWSFRNWFRPWK